MVLMILGFKGFKPGLVATLGNGKFQYVPNELNETEKAMCASLVLCTLPNLYSG